MPHLALKKSGPGFVPATSAAQSTFDKMPVGRMLKGYITQERSAPQHRYYWAMCQLIADALNDGPGEIDWTQESVSDALKIATGRCTLVELSPSMKRKYGTPVAVKPASISFAKMDGAEFSRFLEAAISYVVTEFGDWILEAPEWSRVQEILANSRVPA